MERSSYQVISTSDDYIEHYGVKGMKWGVLRDEEEKRRAQAAAGGRQIIFVPKTPVGPIKNKVEREREANKKYEKEMSDAAREVSAGIAEQLSDPEIREGVKTVLEADEMHEATSELIDIMKEVTLDRIEKQNPTVGKIAKRVDTFLEDFMHFSIDFTKSVNKIIDDVLQSGSNFISWGKKLFGG